MRNQIRALLEQKGRGVHSVSPTDTVADAAEKMSRNEVGSVLVLNRDDLIGILTERDVLRNVVARRLDPSRVTVGEVMTREVVSVGPDNRVDEALALVNAKHIRHVPVRESGRVIGMVSSGDLTRWLARERGQEVDILTEASEREFND